MEPLGNLQRLFAYDAWANQEALVSAKSSGTPGKSLKLMSHIVAVEWLWLSRLRSDARKVVVWPDLTLEECESQLLELKRHWSDYFASLTDKELSRSVSYVNSKGESWKNSREEVLFQVIFHSIAHRGQIATELRSFGFTPPYTDFIHAVRQGFVR